MRQYSTISSKGQLVIPKQIRDLYELDRYTKVTFELSGEIIIIRPVKLDFVKNLREKLRNFEVDPNFRKSLEKSFKRRTKGW